MVKSVLFCFKCQVCFQSSVLFEYFLSERFNMTPVTCLYIVLCVVCVTCVDGYLI